MSVPLPSFAYRLREVRVVFGSGALQHLPAEMRRLGVDHPLILSTPGRADAVAQAQAVLGDRSTGTFTRAQVHVPADIVAEAVEAAVAHHANALVAIGGGSAVGLGKAMAARTGLPLMAVPTTYSGSEMTDIWGVTDGRRKETGRDARVAPKTVLYDPQLTTSLPAGVSAASGVNAMAHAVEALYAADTNPVASLAAGHAVRLLASSLPRIVHQPSDLEARARALEGAHLAGTALDLTSMGLQHKLAHVLGGFGLPHARTHAVLLPHAVAYNGPAVAGALDGVTRVLEARDPWTGLAAFNATLEIEETLADLGLREADLDEAAELATQSAYPNPQPVTRDGVRALLDRAFHGRPPQPSTAS